jgi:hypothetical protein
MFNTIHCAYSLFFLAYFASAVVLPRCAPHPPAGYSSSLEPYDTYHKRYLALDCENKHTDPDFFNACCHPLPANVPLSSRPAECNPSSHSSTKHESAPTPTAHAAVQAPTTTADKSTHTPSSSSSSGDGSPNTGGVATFFFQNGVAGACGQVHQDTDLICAMDSARYGNSGNESPLCGRQVKITNTQNQKTVIVKVADDCPTCDNANSIDLSQTAFEHIATLDQGEVPIEWVFL